MSLRQFVWWESPGNGRRGFSHTHKLAKTLKNGLAKMGLLFLRI
jgi:hypothetical protein